MMVNTKEAFNDYFFAVLNYIFRCQTTIASGKPFNYAIFTVWITVSTIAALKRPLLVT
jgi:hypothetical protein